MTQPPIDSSYRRRAVALLIAVAMLAAATLASSASASAAAMTCGGQQATIVGTSGDDLIFGTAGVDVIVGLDGADTIYGREGNDIICGGAGPDLIFAGRGHDNVRGNGGNDRIKGDLGRDEIRGGNGNDVLVGQAGTDLLFGDSGRDRILGGRAVDTLSGGSGDDKLFGNGGIDTIYGDADTDFCESAEDTRISCELPEVAAPSLTEQYEQESLAIINDERAAKSLPSLSRHPDLDGYARTWAAEMEEIGLPLEHCLHHSPIFTNSNPGCADRPEQPPFPNSVQWTTAFENVGYSTVQSGETPADVMDRLFHAPNGNGFMSSPGHRCNVLETAADQVGLGAFVDSNGAVWVVQVYWGTSSPVPPPIAECESVTGR